MTLAVRNTIAVPPRPARFDIAPGGGDKNRMELNDLIREERGAPGALPELVVESDATVSDDELRGMQRTVAAGVEPPYDEAGCP